MTWIIKGELSVNPTKIFLMQYFCLSCDLLNKNKDKEND